MSENARNALNALLYNTGGASRDFMLVLATNRPTDLDRAVADRVDEHIQFDLPGLAERERLVALYFDKSRLAERPKSAGWAFFSW